MSSRTDPRIDLEIVPLVTPPAGRGLDPQRYGVPVGVAGAELDDLYEVYATSQRHDAGEVAAVFQREEVRADLARPPEGQLRLALLGRADGRPVVAGLLEARTTDNTHLAHLAVDVLPTARGRGAGAAMLAALEDAARALGRTDVTAFVAAPATGPLDAPGGPVAWAVRRGWSVALVDVQRALDLPVADDVLDALAAGAAAHHEGYELRSWVGPVPDDLLPAWAEAVAALPTEAPVGDLPLEPEVPDPAAVRETERLLADQGRVKVNTVAIAPDGTLAAYTEVALTEHESDRAYQWGTLVRAAHRGRRLGLATKIANLRLVQRHAPGVRLLRTYNAEVNDPMIGVNELLGFRVEQRMAELHRRLP